MYRRVRQKECQHGDHESGRELLRIPRIPVAIEARGNFHQLTKFAGNVGQLKRIVNIENVELTQPAMRDGIIQLVAHFNASTYRFKEKAAAPVRKR